MPVACSLAEQLDHHQVVGVNCKMHCCSPLVEHGLLAKDQLARSVLSTTNSGLFVYTMKATYLWTRVEKEPLGATWPHASKVCEYSVSFHRRIRPIEERACGAKERDGVKDFQCDQCLGAELSPQIAPKSLIFLPPTKR